MSATPKKKTPLTYDKLERDLVKWLQRERENINGALIVGSRGRSRQTISRDSDLDVMIYCIDPSRYIKTSWYTVFGRVLTATMSFQPGEERDFEWFIVYEGGVRFNPFFIWQEAEEAGLTRDLNWCANFERHNAVMWRGVRAIYDRTGLGPIRLPAQIEDYTPSPERSYMWLYVLRMAWWEAGKIASALQRGELYAAKLHCDTELKRCLLNLLEWDARQRGVDPWYDGRFLEQWAPPFVVAMLPDLFARYDAKDIWRATKATLGAIEETVKHVFERLIFSFPQRERDRVHLWLDAIVID